MRKASFLTIVLALALRFGGGIAADAFVPGIDDLPLMPGLAAEADALVFDKPDGRIVQATAHGGLERRAVLDFYDSTLPQLGWRRQSAGRYVREGETLAIAIEGGGGRITVQFILSPGKS
jgi:hypothetical protein